MENHLNALKDVLSIQNINKTMLIIAVITFLVTTLLGMILVRLWKKPISKAVVFALLIAYVSVVLYSTVFSRSYAIRQVNLKPFWSYADIIKYHDVALLWDDILNVVLFMPIGFLMGILYNRRKKRIWISTLTGFSLAISIEILQFCLKRGMVEFDDVFHNTGGTLFGCLIWIIIIGIYDKIVPKNVKVINQ